MIQCDGLTCWFSAFASPKVLHLEMWFSALLMRDENDVFEDVVAPLECLWPQLESLTLKDNSNSPDSYSDRIKPILASLVKIERFSCVPFELEQPCVDCLGSLPSLRYLAIAIGGRCLLNHEPVTFANLESLTLALRSLRVEVYFALDLQAEVIGPIVTQKWPTIQPEFSLVEDW